MLLNLLGLGLLSGAGGIPPPPGGKVLLVNNSTGVMTSTDVSNPFASSNTGVSVVELARLSAMEAFTLSNLRANISAGGSGQNNLRLRKNGVNANLFASRTGTGVLEDIVNTDTLAANDTFEVQYTDTGTDSTIDWLSMNLECAEGHGCPYVAFDPGSTWEYDVASSTRFIPFSGRLDDDGVATIGPTQWKLGANYRLHGWGVQVRSPNARLNDSTFRFLADGSPVGNSIVYATTEVGRKTDITQVALSKNQLVSYDITLGAGVEDLTLISIDCLLKSVEGRSEIMAVGHNAASRAASATPTYYRLGGSNASAVDEAAARIRPGFAARIEYPRINVVANTYSAAATLEVLVNGISVISLNIGAGATGWIGDEAAFADITATDEVSVSITGGSTGSISFHGRGFTFAPIPAAGGGGGDGAGTLLRRRRRSGRRH